MLNRSASHTMSTCVLKALPGKLDIKRHSPSTLYLQGLLMCGAQIFLPWNFTKKLYGNDHGHFHIIPL